MRKLYVIFTFFYINRRKIWFRENFRLPFLINLHVLGCPEHEVNISGKCLSVCLCVCDKYFVASVARERMNRISWTFMVEIVQQIALQSNVFQIFLGGCADLGFCWMKWNKNLYTRYILSERTMVQFLRTYLARGRCNSVFSKVLLIVISRLPLHGIAQKFIWNIRTARNDIDIISVIVPH